MIKKVSKTKIVTTISLMLFLLLILFMAANCDSDDNKDTTPPVISGVTISNITATTATISWTTDELATDDIEYGLTKGVYDHSVPNRSDFTSYSTIRNHILSDLSSDETYHFIVISTDFAGNETKSEDYSFTTSNWTADTHPVTFPDVNLESYIRQIINKPTGYIQQSDLAGLTHLYAYGRGITDLTGLEHCTNLTGLDLSDNQISNLSPLSSLTGLTWLFLNNNQISNLTPLSSLTGLTLLILNDNQISDLSPLSSFTSLTGLILNDNQISDIQPLVSNPDLDQGDYINLSNNPLSDASINTYIPILGARGVYVHYPDQ